MRQIARKWELFVSGVEVDLRDIPVIIREAWLRSQRAGVNPALPAAPWHEIPHDPALLKEEVEWLPGAERGLSLLSSVFTEAHQLLCLVDQQGRVLSIRGGRKALARAEQIRAIPGGEWSEEKVGCNVLGTSLYTGAPVQVYWQENYSASWHDWTGQAVPIHHPLTSDILGAISISGHEEVGHPHALELLIKAVEMIEGGIREQETAAHFTILEHLAQLASRYPADGLLAVDKRGIILSLSPAIEAMLSLPHAHLIGRRVQDVPALRAYVGQFPLATSAESARREKDGPGVTVFPVSAGRALGAVLLLPQRARPSTTKKPVEQPWGAAYTFADLVGNSLLFRECVDLARQVSQHDWPVVLQGESGTGKELFAQAIHNAGPRCHGPFVALNCAGLSDELIGMELFGYAEGAFTGALKGGKSGKIQLAHTGTLFLDDVDTLPQKAQVSLLRVLEEGRVVPLGGHKPQRVDIRVIASTNGDLEHCVNAGKFRHDLYHRLSVFPIVLPPLRERREDIPLLARHILSAHAPQTLLMQEALLILQQYSWPGNVRELRNVLLRAAARCQGCALTPADLSPAVTRAVAGTSEASLSRRQALSNVEKDMIVQAMQKTPSVEQAASLLGLHYTTLYRKLKKYGITVVTDRKKSLA